MNKFRKLQSELSERLPSGGDLVRIHHILMKEYGWIPLEEFKETPMVTIMHLLSEIQKDKKAEKKEVDKMKRKTR